MHVDFGAHDECGIIFTLGAATPVTDARTEPPVRASEKILVMGATIAVGYRLVNQSCPGQSVPDAVARLR
jgi:hypothetical protein